MRSRYVKVPDHSTFSLNRDGRFRDSQVLRHVFETVVRRCMDEGLVGGEGFTVDASLIAADANKQRSLPGDEWKIADLPADPGRAVRDYLDTLDNAAFGAASQAKPKFISPSDPGAQWTGAHKGPAFFAYPFSRNSMNHRKSGRPQRIGGAYMSPPVDQSRFSPRSILSLESAPKL
jgi:hypothetical protein